MTRQKRQNRPTNSDSHRIPQRSKCSEVATCSMKHIEPSLRTVAESSQKICVSKLRAGHAKP